MGCALLLSHLGSEKGTPCFPELVETRGQHNWRSFSFKLKTGLMLEGVRGLASIAARRMRSLHRLNRGGWFDLAGYPDFLLTALLIFFWMKEGIPPGTALQPLLSTSVCSTSSRCDPCMKDALRVCPARSNTKYLSLLLPFYSESCHTNFTGSKVQHAPTSITVGSLFLTHCGQSELYTMDPGTTPKYLHSKSSLMKLIEYLMFPV